MSTEKPVSPPGSPAAGATAPAPTPPSADAPPPGTASPAAAAPQPPRPASPPNQATDPVTALQAAFPSMDRTIISEVLAAHGGNPDSASMALLEISSPTSGGAASRTSGEHTRNAQLMSDEAYARELVAQMEREHMQEYGRPMHSPPGQQQQQQSHRQQEVDYSQLNYEPRQRNRFGQPVGQPTQQSGAGQYSYQQQGQHPDDGRWKHQDELDQLTEQFGKLADTGKKTFNSFLSKAKDKYVQVQQQRVYNQQNPGETSANSRGSGAGTGPTTIAGFTIPAIPAPWQGGLGGKQNHVSNQRPASPRENLRSGALSPENRESVMKDYSTSPTNSRPRYETRNSSDDDAMPIQINRSGMPVSQTSRTGTGTATSALSSSPATASPGFSTSPGVQHRNSFGSSPAKIQMLPRQTINLLDDANKDKDRSRSSSPAASGAAATTTGNSAQKRRDDDDDSDNESVEYVKNPFNDDD